MAGYLITQCTKKIRHVCRFPPFLFVNPAHEQYKSNGGHMNVRSLTLAMAVFAATAFAAEVRQTETDAASAFSALKKLAGEWQADTKMGKATLTYEVIA